MLAHKRSTRIREALRLRTPRDRSNFLCADLSTSEPAGQHERLGRKIDALCLDSSRKRSDSAQGRLELAEDETHSLKDRIAALAAEAARERDQIETQRQELAAQRDAEVSAIQDRHWQAMRAEVDEARERWRAQIRELDDLLSLTKRLDRALAPSSPKPKSKAPKPSGTNTWAPGEDKKQAVLEAMRDGAETMPEIDARIPFSSTTILRTVRVLRDNGLVRLSGERPIPKGQRGRPVRTYALTPAGTDYLAANENQ